MCTLTVRRATPESDLLVTMNRDEAMVRAPEHPPKLHESPAGPTWVAPHDGERGGTWMGANDSGLIACLLNFYLPDESLLPDREGTKPSRGAIIPELLERGDTADAMAWLLGDFDPEPYPSFDLHLISTESIHRLIWVRDGRFTCEEVKGEWNVYSSSGWDSAEVAEWRTQRFHEWLDRGCPMIGSVPEFHLLQEEGHAERSPLMKRDWSETRSVTQARISATDKRVYLGYWSYPEPMIESRGERMSIPLHVEKAFPPV